MTRLKSSESSSPAEQLAKLSSAQQIMMGSLSAGPMATKWFGNRRTGTISILKELGLVVGNDAVLELTEKGYDVCDSR